MLKHLIHFLGTEIELNAEEVADLLWLTLERQKRVQKVEITEQQETPDSKTEDSTTFVDDSKSQPQPQDLATPPPPQSSPVGIYTRFPCQAQTSTPQGYIPLPVPDPRVLNHPLDLLKSLKPLLLRVPSNTEEIINEAATADWIARTDLWQVITEPDLELWLDLVLVVDESVSMVLWRRTVEELQQFLQHYGIFRDVRVWGMGLDPDNNLYFRSAIRSHQPKELIDVQGRRLILLVSDFVDVLWHQEQILTILEQWSNSNPVAALQMLPEWLWSRSALALHTPAILCNSKGDIINRNLEALVNRLQKRRGLDQGIKLPVFSLEPEQTKRWSQMLTGGEGTLGYVLRRDLLGYQITTASQPNAQERVTNFSANASPLAHKLAGLLAAAPVITMPVVRLIRDSMLPEVDQIQIAEVFLGGLLKPLPDITPETDPESVHYDFMEGVRAELLKIVPVPERDEVLDWVSRYVAKGLGKCLREFIAWLQNPSEVAGTEAGGLVKPFARLTREILGQLGQGYETLHKGYWLLSDADLWNSYITILDFAQYIYHTFQVLEHEYLHHLYSLVNNILSKPETLNLENSKHLETTWINYVNRYSELKEQFLKNGFDDESQKVIDQSWSVVKTVKKEAIVSQLSEAENYYKNIIESFGSYAECHEEISSFVGTGENLFTDLTVPNNAMKFGVNFLNLERRGRSLTSNAERLSRILIQILVEEIDPDTIYLMQQPYRGYWLLSDANLWNSYITILDFAQYIRHTFQVLEHQYLHDLYSLVNNILTKPETLNLENSKHLETTWINYVNRYSELKEQFLKNGFDDESQKVIDQSWSVVKTVKKEAIVSQLSEAENYYKNIIESFGSYAECHEEISSFVGTGENLFTDLTVPNNAMKFGVGVNFLNLERRGRSLTSNADNLIRILIQILLEE